MADDNFFETSKHVPETEKRCCVFKDYYESHFKLSFLFLINHLLQTLEFMKRNILSLVFLMSCNF